MIPLSLYIGIQVYIIPLQSQIIRAEEMHPFCQDPALSQQTWHNRGGGRGLGVTLMMTVYLRIYSHLFLGHLFELSYNQIGDCQPDVMAE